jgi:hypothetical protein
MLFQEDEAEDDVFVFSGVEVPAKFVGGSLQGGLKAEVSLETDLTTGAVRVDELDFFGMRETR